MIFCCTENFPQGNNNLDNGSVVYGFAFVDCAALRFWVGSIDDDASCSALGALLLQVCLYTNSSTYSCYLVSVNGCST